MQNQNGVVNLATLFIKFSVLHRSSVLSNNESTVSSDDYPNGWNYERKLYPGRLLNKPPSRPSSASCIQTNYKSKSLTMVENEDRSSSETNLLLQTSTAASEPAQQNDEPLSQGGVAERDTDEDAEAVLLQPKEYKMGKFLSISDTMLPTEERVHEYIAESPAPPPPQPIVARKAEDEATKAQSSVKEENGYEKEAAKDEEVEKFEEDEVPRDYQPGKFVTQSDTTSNSQSEEIKDTTEEEKVEKSEPPATPMEMQLGKFVSQNNTTNSLPDDANDRDVKPALEKPTPSAITDLEGEKSATVEPEKTSEQSSKKENKTQPSNRWFDAYMKCKAAQAKAAPVRKRIPPPIKEVPDKKPVKQEEPPPEPPVNARNINMDDFEKVQKITPSKSQKWREAMQKYKTLEQKTTTPSPQATSSSGSEEKNSESSSAKSPQKSAEEPTYSSLAQRAQMFGGMRKKPPLRRAKSFQIGSSDSASSPLASGLTRPTRVLKRQSTASSFN